MIKLLEIELLKMRNSRTFWGVMGIYLLFVVLFDLIVTQIRGHAGELLTAPWSFPNIWVNMYFFLHILNYIPALVIISSVTTDMQTRTYRQHIIDGMSRVEYFVGKMQLAILLSLVIAVFTFLNILTFGFIFSPAGTDIGIKVGMEILLTNFISTFGYMGIAFIVALWLRASILSTLFYLGYVILLESLIGLLFNYMIHGLQNVLPCYALGNITPGPRLLDDLKIMAGYKGVQWSLGLKYAVACFYICAFYGASYLIINKRDIK